MPGTTVDRQCGSSQQAIHFAAQAVLSGTMDVVVAGGVQQMSQIPISSAMTAGQAYGFDDPFSGSTGWVERYGTQEVSQFRSAEMIAEKWDLSRDDMEAFAVTSHERAIRARAEGRFEAEIVPLGECTAAEGPREPNWDKIRSLPTLTEGGRVTAACASQISDASAALLIVNQKGLAAHGLTPRARIHHISVRADDPVWMLTAPIPATAHALAKTGRASRHRPGGDQRGVRLGGAGVAKETGANGQGQRERWRHRPRPPARRHRRALMRSLLAESSDGGRTPADECEGGARPTSQSSAPLKGPGTVGAHAADPMGDDLRPGGEPSATGQLGRGTVGMAEGP